MQNLQRQSEIRENRKPWKFSFALVSCGLRLKYLKSWKSQQTHVRTKESSNRARPIFFKIPLRRVSLTMHIDTRYTIHTSMYEKISEGSTVQGFMFGEVPACTMPRDQVAWVTMWRFRTSSVLAYDRKITH